MNAPKSNELHFRLAENTVGDAGQFCALSNSLYARPVTPAYYEWQFFQCPFPSLLNLAVDAENNIVGTYGLHVQEARLPNEFSAAGKTTAKIVWVLDIMVSPAVQRQGVFRRLVEFGYKNLRALDEPPAAIVVMANEKADRACVEGLNWTRINTFLTYFAEPQAAHAADKFALEYERIEDFAACREVLEANAFAASLFANARSVAYQNWRFARNARYRYDIFAARKNGKPFGCLVLKIFRDPASGQAFGDIVDVLWLENDRAAIAEMLRFALAHFYDQQVGSSAMWLQTNTVLDEIGAAVGFRRSAQKRFFCGKALQPEFSDLETARRWFINMSDSEVY